MHLTEVCALLHIKTQFNAPDSERDLGTPDNKWYYPEAQPSYSHVWFVNQIQCHHGAKQSIQTFHIFISVRWGAKAD